MSAPDILTPFGIRRIVNAAGPSTRLSGAPARPEVAAAMAAAAQACFDMAALQARAGEIIAAATGAEAGYVTSGAAAGLMLGAAACVTGTDPALINRLPDTSGLRCEAIVARSHRNMYDHAVSQAGLRLVEVGIPDRYAGAGVRDAQAWEYAAAVTERTALILWVAHAGAEPPLPEVVAVARAHGIPVMVDAAAQLPPRENLRRFVAEGADLVAFSGGKAIGGPQGSGILAGRRDLIEAVAMNQLDHDTFFEQWSPPPSLIDKARVRGLPASGIGRPTKVGKEQIVGLLAALELFLAEDPAARHAEQLQTCEALAEGLAGLPGTELTIEAAAAVPKVSLRLLPAAPMTARELVKRLQDGEPSVNCDHGRVRDGIVVLGPACLLPGDVEIIVSRMRAELTA